MFTLKNEHMKITIAFTHVMIDRGDYYLYDHSIHDLKKPKLVAVIETYKSEKE